MNPTDLKYSARSAVEKANDVAAFATSTLAEKKGFKGYSNLITSRDVQHDVMLTNHRLNMLLKPQVVDEDWCEIAQTERKYFPIGAHINLIESQEH